MKDILVKVARNFQREAASDLLWELINRHFTKSNFADTLTWALPNDVAANLSIMWPNKYSWPYADKWLSHVRLGLSKHVRVRTSNFVQPEGTKAGLTFTYGGKSYLIVIDYSDYPEIDRIALDKCHLYFKMQHSVDGYDSPKIVPGGYIPNSLHLYSYLPALWKFQSIGAPASDYVYGRFGIKTGGDIRRTAVTMLAQQERFNYIGNDGKFVRYSRYLKEAARAAVTIDLPGNGDFCFRLIDYMAIGCCVILPKPKVRLHVPLEHGVHVHFCKRDLSDFLDSCDYYLSNIAARKVMAKNASEFFRKYLHYEQLSSYYIHTFLSSINAA